MKRSTTLAAALCSTILTSFIGASAFAAAGHHHHGHTDKKDGLAIGGIMDFRSALVDQDVEHQESRDYSFSNDTEVHVKFANTTENGLRYGAVIELEADVTEAAREEGENADKTYIFAETNLGRAELGAVDDAAHRIGVDASTFARATGGIHGDWFEHVFFPGEEGGHGHGHGEENPYHIGHNDFIHAPALPLHHAHGAAEDANKISYFTPQLHGFQAGVSFIPDSGDSGSTTGISGKAGHREFNDVFNGGVSYETAVDVVTIKTSFTGEFGRYELPGHENLGAWAWGLNLEAHGFSLGGSYGDWNQSVTHVTPNRESASYYTLGAGYSWGDGGVSLGWFASEYARNETEVLSLGVDHSIAPGLTPYVEYSLVELDASDATVEDQDAQVLLAGVMIQF